MFLYKCPCCNQKLEIDSINKRVICQNRHSFDISKKGYVNLLLANQGNHFVIEGDKKEAISARSFVLNSGLYSFLKDELVSIIKQCEPKTFLDIACGEGYYTKAIHESIEDLITYGVDLSKAGINECVKRTRENHNIYFAIGNLDYLPYLDNSFDVLLNCFAPINEREFARVCKRGGTYIRVLPGQNHLLELKKELYEHVRLNEPKEETLEGFTIIDKKNIVKQVNIDNQLIRNLFLMTPYAYKTNNQAKEKLFMVPMLNLTLEFSIFIYKKI